MEPDNQLRLDGHLKIELYAAEFKHQSQPSEPQKTKFKYRPKATPNKPDTKVKPRIKSDPDDVEAGRLLKSESTISNRTISDPPPPPNLVIREYTIYVTYQLLRYSSPPNHILFACHSPTIFSKYFRDIPVTITSVSTRAEILASIALGLGLKHPYDDPKSWIFYTPRRQQGSEYEMKQTGMWSVFPWVPTYDEDGVIYVEMGSKLGPPGMGKVVEMLKGRIVDETFEFKEVMGYESAVRKEKRLDSQARIPYITMTPDMIPMSADKTKFRFKAEPNRTDSRD